MLVKPLADSRDDLALTNRAPGMHTMIPIGVELSVDTKDADLFAVDVHDDPLALGHLARLADPDSSRIHVVNLLLSRALRHVAVRAHAGTSGEVTLGDAFQSRAPGPSETVSLAGP